MTETVLRLNSTDATRDLVLTVGTFDGVHLGHRHLVQQVVRRASELGCLAGAITFHPHPRVVVAGHGPASLCTLDARLALLRELGLDVVVALPFTQDVARLPAYDFMDGLCQSLRLRELWVGSDFALGYRREGTVSRLAEIGRELGFEARGVPPLVAHGQIVSSSLVRELVGQGRVDAAARLLLRRHYVTGVAMCGARRERHLGYPATKVVMPDGLAMPAGGFYAAHVRSEERHWLATVQVEPDLDGTVRRLNVAAPDLSGEPLGGPLRVEFVRRLRPGTPAQAVQAPKEQALVRMQCLA